MNDHRASHKVYPIGDFGYCIKLFYKGYEVSLACDGETTRVYHHISQDHLAEFPGTTGAAVLQALEFVDLTAI